MCFNVFNVRLKKIGKISEAFVMNLKSTLAKTVNQLCVPVTTTVFYSPSKKYASWEK